ncbi:unnamed protein product [Aspergillus oryzae]|nr:unnamed protein product [Aspergillus oryzae]
MWTRSLVESKIVGLLFTLVGINLHSSTGDEEPLVNAAINRGRGEVLALRNGGKLAGFSTVGGVRNGDVLAIESGQHGLPSHGGGCTLTC